MELLKVLLYVLSIGLIFAGLSVFLLWIITEKNEGSRPYNHLRVFGINGLKPIRLSDIQKKDNKKEGE